MYNENLLVKKWGVSEFKDIIYEILFLEHKSWSLPAKEKNDTVFRPRQIFLRKISNDQSSIKFFSKLKNWESVYWKENG